MKKVYLVGAGPGDPNLITVRGRELLSQADCVIYDRLAAPELLSLVREDCELIYVGKENRNHTISQQKIHELLLQKAEDKEMVVRLKGGDPFVFGRGGEEALALTEGGIDFEVVPGVSSAIAAAAAAGIPVTHRGLAGGFHVVSAHSQRDCMAELDFEAMARGKDTCLFLMGFRELAQIVEGLLGAGMPGDMDIALISCGTMPGQRVCQGTLATITEMAEQADLVPPVLIAVGRTVALRKKLDSRKKGCFLVPGIGSSPGGLAAMLREKGLEANEIRLSEIVLLDWISDDNNRERELPDWLFFTSRNGVKGFFYGLNRAGWDIRRFSACKVAAVGEKTAEELRKYGICADFIPDRADAGHLAREWREQAAEEASVWYLKASDAVNHMAEYLAGHSALTEIAVYENRFVKLPDMPNLHRYDGILFTSGMLARQLFRTCPGSRAAVESCPVFSIGPKCTETLRSLGCQRIYEASDVSYESLAEEVWQYWYRCQDILS